LLLLVFIKTSEKICYSSGRCSPNSTSGLANDGCSRLREAPGQARVHPTCKDICHINAHYSSSAGTGRGPAAAAAAAGGESAGTDSPTVAPGDSGATRIGGDADLWKYGGCGDAKISDGDDADWRRTRPRPRRRQRSPLIVATARWQTQAGRHRNSPARIQNQRVKQIWFIPPLRSTKGDGPNNALHRAVVIERHDACDSASTT
jgi:hypothetical protein